MLVVENMFPLCKGLPSSRGRPWWLNWQQNKDLQLPSVCPVKLGAVQRDFDKITAPCHIVWQAAQRWRKCRFDMVFLFLRLLDWVESLSKVAQGLQKAGLRYADVVYRYPELKRIVILAGLEFESICRARLLDFGDREDGRREIQDLEHGRMLMLAR